MFVPNEKKQKQKQKGPTGVVTPITLTPEIFACASRQASLLVKSKIINHQSRTTSHPPSSLRSDKIL